MYFDLELLTNVKLHSKYDFPFKLNLKKYVYEAKKVELRTENDIN